MEYTLTDIELWMKAVKIDAYYHQMVEFGVKKGADLKYIEDFELQVSMHTHWTVYLKYKTLILLRAHYCKNSRTLSLSLSLSPPPLCLSL